MGQLMSYQGNLADSSLTLSLAASGATSFTISGTLPSGTGGPFVVEIVPATGSTGSDEKILCTSFSGGTVQIASGGRGWDGTTPQAHNIGDIVRHVFDAASAADANQHIYTTTRDDHTQYLNVARHDTTARHGPTSVSHSGIGNLGNDDHTQYYNQARHDAHPHPAGAFATGPGVITRAMLAGAAQGLMIGQLIWRAGGISTAEQSYLLPCDGAPVSRTGWAALFAQIGTTYGPGDGSTTFNVPDARDMVLIGASPTAPTQQTGSNNNLTGRSARSEAAVLGAEGHVLTVAELAAHSHPATDSGHSHGINDPQHSHNNIVGETGLGGTDSGWVAERDDNSPQGVMTSPTGVHLTFASPAAVGTGAAATGVTTQSGAANTTTSNTGSGTSHNNMQPSLAIPCFIVAA